MRESGRTSIVALAGIACAILIIAVLFFSKESPSAAASEFMGALARGDIKTLTERSYIPNNTPEQIRKKWEFTMKEVAPYYRFAWQVRSHKQTSDDQAAVNIGFVKDVGSPSAYEEKLELPLLRQGGKWLVDVRSMERQKFPGLPR